MRRLIGAAAALLLCSFTTACARPIGDFGRAEHGALHDEIMPTIGKARANLSGEPVSAFNLTDQEREMHDRVWRFLVAPHADYWFMDTVVEWQRTRLIAAADDGFERDRYFRWLRDERYRSSRIRYRTVADDAKSDIDTAPTTFRAVCQVIEVDRQRAVASRELGDIGEKDVVVRRAENDLYIAWFTRALRYRYDAYGYALDHLLVETPHEEAIEVDGRLSELEVWVERAERGDFCDGTDFGGGGKHQGLPSRVLMLEPSEGDFLK